MSEPLISLPSLCLILSPYDGGKTSLIKYLILEHVEEIAAMVIISNSADDRYWENYPFVHRKYCWSDYKDGFLEKNVIPLARSIKKHSGKHTIVIFDDSIGMCKSLFKKEEAKKLQTTLKQVNCSLFCGMHQIQHEVTTLMRNNAKDAFIFNGSEPNGLVIMYNNWGAPSVNLHTEGAFMDRVNHLKKYEWLHYSKRDNQTFTQGTIPWPLPNFRLYLCPDDKTEAQERGLDLLFGNSLEYDLSAIERPNELIEEAEKAAEPRFRDKTEAEKEEEIMNDPSTQAMAEDVIEEQEETNKRKIEDESEEEKPIQDLPPDDPIQEVEDEEEPKHKKKKKRRKNKKSKEEEEEEKQKEEEMEKQIKFLENGHEEEKDPIKKIVSWRARNMLLYASRNPVLRERILSSFPHFFDDENYHEMSLTELLKKKREMDDAFAITDVITSTGNHYKAASMLFKSFAQYGLGFQGQGLDYVDSLYASQLATDTLHNIGKINPLKPPQVSSTDHILNLFMPGAEMLLRVKKSMDFQNELKVAGEATLSPEALNEYEELFNS